MTDFFNIKNSLIFFARENVSDVVHIHFNVDVAAVILLNQKEIRNLTLRLPLLGLLLIARKLAKN